MKNFPFRVISDCFVSRNFVFYPTKISEFKILFNKLKTYWIINAKSKKTELLTLMITVLISMLTDNKKQMFTVISENNFYVLVGMFTSITVIYNVISESFINIESKKQKDKIHLFNEWVLLKNNFKLIVIFFHNN